MFFNIFRKIDGNSVCSRCIIQKTKKKYFFPVIFYIPEKIISVLTIIIWNFLTYLHHLILESSKYHTQILEFWQLFDSSHYINNLSELQEIYLSLNSDYWVQMFFHKNIFLLVFNIFSFIVLLEFCAYQVN